MQLATIEKPTREDRDFVKLIDKGNYFKEMDLYIQNSPTATMAVLMFKKYCTLPNLKEQYLEMWDKIVDERIRYGYFTLWAEFKIDDQTPNSTDIVIKDVHFRKDKNYRARKHDDVGNVGEYLNAQTGKKYPAFNKNQTVLKAQIKKIGGLKKFTGQIYQYNTTTYPYEITPLFSVAKWMKIEDDTPTHISASGDNALFGNSLYIMVKEPESSDTAEDKDAEGIDRPVSNTDRVISALRSGRSAKESGTNLVLTLSTESPLDEIFKKIDLSNNIDLDKFNQVDDKAQKKICTACYCFPQILCSPSEGMFGNNGTAYKAALDFWAATCKDEAAKIEKAINKMGIELQNAPAEVEAPTPPTL